MRRDHNMHIGSPCRPVIYFISVSLSRDKIHTHRLLPPNVYLPRPRFWDARDQTRPGSLFSRSWGRGERDPGNEVAQNKSSNQVSIFNSLFSITSVFIIASKNFSCVATVLFSCDLGKIVSLPCLFQVLVPSRQSYVQIVLLL